MTPAATTAAAGIVHQPSHRTVDETVGPEYLQRRHGLQHELVANIAVVEGLAARAAE